MLIFFSTEDTKILFFLKEHYRIRIDIISNHLLENLTALKLFNQK